MFKLELGNYIVLSVYHKGYSVNKSSIPNTGIELIFDGPATYLNDNLYDQIFNNKGRFTLESYTLELDAMPYKGTFKLKSIDCYTGDYRDVLDLIKETELTIYKQLNYGRK